MNSIISLLNILNKKTFDEKEFNKFIRTKGAKEFIKYEKDTNDYGNIRHMKEELKKVVLDEYYRDQYEFHLIKRNIEKLNRDIDYIKENEKEIIDKVLKEVYKIVPRCMTINFRIYLYAGGTDGGFTINRKKVFINYGKYIGNKEEFIKILSHELYHSRDIPLKTRFIFFLNILLRTNRLIYEIIGKFLEEGIASLVQHGPYLQVDDLAGTLTKRNLLFLREQFQLLNKCLLGVKFDNISRKDTEKLNFYVIGYHIVTTIYNKEGVLILDEWTENLKYGKIIKKYVEICNTDNISSGFTKEVLDFIINEREAQK